MMSASGIMGSSFCLQSTHDHQVTSPIGLPMDKELNNLEADGLTANETWDLLQNYQMF